jgi:hypothetical protein
MKLVNLFIAVTASLAALSQNGDVKITGRVYTSLAYTINKMRSDQPVQVNGKHYLSDYKVILVEVPATTDRQFWDRWKESICTNNGSLPAGLTTRQTYTDKGGAYEFTGLRRNATYVLVFCGRQIQLYSISTGTQDPCTYTVAEKPVEL